MVKKSYLKEANQHSAKIKYYFDHAGPNGHSQANHHYHKLGECYSKSAQNQAGDAFAIKCIFEDAGKLMAIMKSREEGKPDEEPPVKK